jgi:HEAT repeat protein
MVKDKGELPSIRASAMSALRAVKADWSTEIGFLVESLDDPVLDHRALSTLEQLGPRAKDAVPALVRRARSKLSLELLRLFETIGPGAKDAIPLLMEVIKNGPTVGHKAIAAQALGSIGPQTKEVIPELLRALNAPGDENYELREGAAWALGRIGPPAAAAVPALIKAVREDHDYLSVRDEAIEALGKIGKKAEKALPEILRVLDSSPSEFQRRSAATAVGRIAIANPLVVETLRKALKDADEDVRIAAVCSLWQLSKVTEQDILVLVSFLNETTVDRVLERADAMRVLADIGPKAKAAVPALLRVLKDDQVLLRVGIVDKDWLRTVAADALKKIDPEAAKKAGVK